MLGAFYPQRHLVSVVRDASSGPKDSRRGPRRPSSCPRGGAAPRPCAGGTTACPGSTPSHTASRGPAAAAAAVGGVGGGDRAAVLTCSKLMRSFATHRFRCKC